MNKKNYDRLVFFDTETTGLDPKRDRIIELAAVAVSADMEPLDKIDALVRLPEGMQVPEFIRGLTGITDEELALQGVPEDEAVRRFQQMLDEKTLVVAYNAQFDLEFILEAMRRLGIAEEALYKADFLDPCTVFRERHPFQSHKLAAAIEAYGLSGVQNSHRALDDVKALMALYSAMQEEDGMDRYINIFGYRVRYGLPSRPLDKVKYFGQI